jgi:hypothetical protein
VPPFFLGDELENPFLDVDFKAYAAAVRGETLPSPPALRNSRISRLARLSRPDSRAGPATRDPFMEGFHDALSRL